MSGGVDSSVALLLTKENLGGDVLGVTLALTDPLDPQGIADARSVCEKMGTRHEAVYAQKEFKERVIDYFVREYLEGRTPNPCVICNRDIKFGLLADYADARGAGRIVTGHYARLSTVGGYTYIRRAADPKKDQSYMLAFLSQEQIRRAYFPLGELTKDEVRRIADEHGFVNAHKHDSQDVCFIPDGDYVKAIERITGISPIAGDYIDKDGNVLGKHRGHWCTTIGQRKGLGIALGRRVSVIAKDVRANTVTLGDEADLMQTRVDVDGLNLPSDPHALDGEVRCMAKIRYAHKAAPATFVRTGEKCGTIVFDEPQRAPSSGQFAVIYDEADELVLGAGVIC